MALKEGLDAMPVVIEAAGEDFEWCGSEQGDGTGAGLSAIEPDEAWEVGQMACEDFRGNLPGALDEARCRHGCTGHSVGAEGGLLWVGAVNH